MTPYAELRTAELQALKEKLLARYRAFQGKELTLDMTRGKPCPEQLDLAMGMLVKSTGSIVPIAGWIAAITGALTASMKRKGFSPTISKLLTTRSSSATAQA